MLVDPFFRKLVGSIRRRVRPVLPLSALGAGAGPLAPVILVFHAFTAGKARCLPPWLAG
jgi:hypothetical protein